MRMDRYEEENSKQDSKQSRLNKNQELYTDVYLNNVYVDINSISEVVNSSDEKKEEVKVHKEPIEIDYTYEEKNYDINAILEKALENKQDDNLKRSIDIASNEEKIENVIESINEKMQEEKKEALEDDLLSDLLPANENTEVIPPLEEPILDTSVYHQSVLVLPTEETEEYELFDKEDDIKKEDMEEDFLDEAKKPKHLKLIIIISVIILLIGIVAILKILNVF